MRSTTAVRAIEAYNPVRALAMKKYADISMFPVSATPYPRSFKRNANGELAIDRPRNLPEGS